MLLAATNTVILGFNTHGIHGHTLLSNDPNSIQKSLLDTKYIGDFTYKFSSYLTGNAFLLGSKDQQIKTIEGSNLIRNIKAGGTYSDRWTLEKCRLGYLFQRICYCHEFCLQQHFTLPLEIFIFQTGIPP
jgi:hypothetical protein